MNDKTSGGRYETDLLCGCRRLPPPPHPLRYGGSAAGLRGRFVRGIDEGRYGGKGRPPGDPKADAIVSEEKTNAIFLTNLNIVLHLLKGPIIPFITAGGGGVMTIDKGSFAYNYGGGVKIFLTKKFALRLDFREYRAKLKDNIEQIDDVRPGGVFIGRQWDYSEDLKFREISGGLTYLFHH